jgi:hypothetical protein
MHNADSLSFEIGQLWIKPSSGQTDKGGPIIHSELNINLLNVIMRIMCSVTCCE